MTVREILNEATRELETAGMETARLDAEVLLAFCLNCDRLEFLKNPDMQISKSQLAVFNKLVSRRLKWEPVAYITGRKEFWSFTLEVNKGVLIPRPDTEIILEEALAVGKNIIAPRIADIGTGSGAIALALAKELPEPKITATDISPAALKVAKKNARNLKLGKNIEFLKGDLFAPVKGLFDIIVSNPPYISAAEYEELPRGVKDFEPKIALLAGQTGVEFYEKLIYQSKNHLKKDGWLLMEIGAPQAEKIRDIMQECAFFEDIDVRRDYAGHDRVIKGRKK
ncbi:MAG TPA: peptide chain release factor N(5)-glutamine methyltransferase [Smithellaceae bacterium]|jgi:release factor glutamine methyltransferase|nr:peptide chain release factor N(5)-glutamine methyltransferase [Syntrophaceae bacterium]HOF77656.1 peptide chain release factor N(5)-glutamine methyltransferase [Smithellaceae bacterium]HOM69024.1 peptide chain release factor N(5)-glutamine methyltransferase [Smithellaceae bacterium]HOS09583.1 peptide chain release factor N(5)-glutamine methyltransferase [Smithellaceae bacterium]HPD50470.1 peptide chain release factor N(5)-glutamine methyltransferase [Smithellaceae bacterium]